MKKIIISLIIISLFLAGCASGISSKYSYTPAPTSTAPKATQTKQTGSSDTNYEDTHQDQTWLSPGKVQIGNYYPGARAEWNIRVHNGNSSFTQKMQVITDPNETVVNIKLNKMLYGDLANVLFISDNKNDSFKAINYDSVSQELTITGFAPEEKRIMDIKYDAFKKYLISYKEPTSLIAGYSVPPKTAQSWIIITDSSIVLAPRETKEVPISVAMPEDAISPEKWEFWVSMVEDDPAGSIVTQLVSRWLVAMRG